MFLLTAACNANSEQLHSDAATPADTPDADTADAAEPDAGAYTRPLSAGEWDDMGFEARGKFMREMLLPAMRQAFHDFDPVRFASIGCKTCHGSGAATRGFLMPASELPALSSAAIMNPDEAERAITAFMRMVVRPQVATLLGAESGTPAAVRCASCHTITP